MRLILVCLAGIACMFYLSMASADTDYSAFKKPSDQVLQQTLTPIQYQVTQQQGTEPPYHNAYWNNEEPGIYVDVVSGAPLFLSLDKYDSKTGWPSFTKPVEPGNIVLRTDKSILPARTEVVSRYGDSHLGHVFDDGPAPTYQRYCMNSAAMVFIPLADMKKKGYGKYLKYFAAEQKKGQ